MSADDFERALHVADADMQEGELLDKIRKIGLVLDPEARYRVLDHLNAVASDLFDDEYEKLNP